MPRPANPPHLVARSDRLFAAMMTARAAQAAPAPRDPAALLADIAARIAAAGRPAAPARA